MHLRSSPSEPVRSRKHSFPVSAAVLEQKPGISPPVMPFFAKAGGFIGNVLGNWRLNTIISAQSGAPFTVNLGVDQANVGAGPAQRPDQLRDADLGGGQRTPDRWFDTAAF